MEQTHTTSIEIQDVAEWKKLAHKMVEEMFDHVSTSAERPSFNAPAQSAIDSMKESLPERSSSNEIVYDDFKNNILPYHNNNMHPRFWAWVQGGGTYQGMMADFLAATINPNVSIGNHMPMYVEQQVLNWSKEMFGFPSEASGILTSGASMANLTALLVARHAANANIKTKGLAANKQQLVAYGSAETHNCVFKSAEVIGIGSEFFRKIPVDTEYKIDLAQLRKQIETDLSNGLQPFCIVGNAGTVNTGAIDPIDDLYIIAKEFNCWLHIDGAFGAIPAILPEYAWLKNALAKADSLSFDFHKWLYINYEVACVLIKDAALHKSCFVSNVTYLVQHEEGLSAGPESYANYGIELSRGFKALKVWMSLKHYGLNNYRNMVSSNIQQSAYLVSLIEQNDQLELTAPAPLNVICFRFKDAVLDKNTLNALNKKILMQLHVRGIASPSYTTLNGIYTIRVAHTNHRSRDEDFEALVAAVIQIGNELKPLFTNKISTAI